MTIRVNDVELTWTPGESTVEVRAYGRVHRVTVDRQKAEQAERTACDPDAIRFWREIGQRI